MENDIEIDEILGEREEYQSVEAFAKDEMIECKACKRKNPPTRLDCIYCAKPLEISEDQMTIVKPVLRNTETWKIAENLIIECAPDFGGSVEQLAELVRIDYLQLENAFKLGKPVPVARTEQERELELVSEKISTIGAKVYRISDEKLNGNKPPRRVRKIEFGEKGFEFGLIGAAKPQIVAYDQRALLVVGMIFERQIESVASMSKKQESELLDATETADDELTFDFYPEGDELGFRISASRFDFSGLGEKKSLVVKENMDALLREFRDKCADIDFDTDFAKLRGILSSIWEPEERLDDVKTKRASFRSARKTTKTTTNNQKQFTKYSRMRWILARGDIDE